MKSVKAMLRPNQANTHVRRMLASICLRRPKNAIDLPGRVDEIHKVEFDPEEAAQYKTMNDLLTGCLENIGAYSNMLTKINSLRQICNLGTQYQAHIDSSFWNGAHDTGAQELFDNMLSAGVAICSKCEKDLSVVDETKESQMSVTDVVDKPQLQIATCGVLICASCFAISNVAMGPKDRGCQHQPLCEFFAVDVSASPTTPAYPSNSRLPVKMRALQKDILDLPETDKR